MKAKALGVRNGWKADTSSSSSRLMGTESPLAILLLLLPWIFVLGVGVYAVVLTIRLLRGDDEEAP